MGAWNFTGKRRKLKCITSIGIINAWMAKKETVDTLPNNFVIKNVLSREIYVRNVLKWIAPGSGFSWCVVACLFCGNEDMVSCKISVLYSMYIECGTSFWNRNQAKRGTVCPVQRRLRGIILHLSHIIWTTEKNEQTGCQGLRELFGKTLIGKFLEA